jgi:ubiquinone biosynthesis protein
VALADLVKLPRNLQRLAEIIIVFVRHGFGSFVARLNLQEHIPFAKRLLARRVQVVDKEASTEERLANALQELGTTFVKLGQILSSRPDIVGPTYAEAFKTLRDKVKPFDAARARAAIEAELDLPPDEVFAEFEDEPAGCGSIAQVHRARLEDGTAVMVKVKRPGIERDITADLGLLRFVAKMAEPQLPEVRPVQIVEEFERAIRDELDFTVEASNTSEFQQMFEEMDHIRAPRVFWEYSTASVLVIERLEGISIADVDRLDREGIDRKELARTLADCFMHQYFRAGTFHADPHPGNLVVDRDGGVGVIDFGMVGHLTSSVKSQMSTMLIAAVYENIDFIAETMSEIGASGPEFQYRLFNRDLTDLFHKYSGVPLGRVDTRRLFSDLARAARDNDLSLPRDLVLLGKSLATLSSVTRTLDPGFDVLRFSTPRVEEVIKDKFSPQRVLQNGGLTALSFLHMLRNLPRDLRNIVRKLEAGHLQIGFHHRGLERPVNELDRTGNRLAMSVYVAALLVSSSLMINARFLPVNGVSVPGVLGFAFAGFLSLWLAWGILRSGRL